MHELGTVFKMISSIEAGGKSDLILKILKRHSRFYRYDAHDTIVLNHIHFGSLLVVRRRF